MSHDPEYNRRWRQANPVRYAYGALRDNAKRRGKVFDLSFEQFEKFCIRTEYMTLKGRTLVGYHIDRIDNDKGYTMNNIQMLPAPVNCAKQDMPLDQWKAIVTENLF